jgi:hypothetical protein
MPCRILPPQPLNNPPNVHRRNYIGMPPNTYAAAKYFFEFGGGCCIEIENENIGIACVKKPLCLFYTQ